MNAWLTINTALVMQGFVRILDRFGADHRAGVSEDGKSSGGCIYGTIDAGRLSPVCIVGQFFDDLGLLGVLMNNVADPEGGAFCSVDGAIGQASGLYSAREMLSRRGIEFEDAAIDLLKDAQGVQDSGLSWGKAIESALDKALYAETITLPNVSHTERMRALVG